LPQSTGTTGGALRIVFAGRVVLAAAAENLFAFIALINGTAPLVSRICG
jgi:hypothetical protein